MNVKDMYLSHEISKELKDIGFNEKCDYYYRDIEGSEEKLFYRLHPSMNNEEVNKNTNHNMITAVTYDQAIEWFIEEHELDIEATVNAMQYSVGVVNRKITNAFYEDSYKTRREALQAGIKKAIEIVKSSKTENK